MPTSWGKIIYWMATLIAGLIIVSVLGATLSKANPSSRLSLCYLP